MKVDVKKIIKNYLIKCLINQLKIIQKPDQILFIGLSNTL